MLTLFYGPGACSMASHIVLEESGEKYEAKRMDLAKGEQRTDEYKKIHPLGRVPALMVDQVHVVRVHLVLGLLQQIGELEGAVDAARPHDDHPDVAVAVDESHPRPDRVSAYP